MSIPFHKRQLGTGFTSDGGRNTHVISNGRNKVNQLHGIISNRLQVTNLQQLIDMVI